MKFVTISDIPLPQLLVAQRLHSWVEVRVVDTQMLLKSAKFRGGVGPESVQRTADTVLRHEVLADSPRLEELEVAVLQDGDATERVVIVDVLGVLQV